MTLSFLVVWSLFSPEKEGKKKHQQHSIISAGRRTWSDCFQCTIITQLHSCHELRQTSAHYVSFTVIQTSVLSPHLCMWTTHWFLCAAIFGSKLFQAPFWMLTIFWGENKIVFRNFCLSTKNQRESRHSLLHTKQQNTAFLWRVGSTWKKSCSWIRDGIFP